jgi:hypothetical protein
MYDIIGDIHGHADELVELLHRLGYRESGQVFRHPERQVIFCGDFIDRGPQIRDTLAIARSMCEAGAAQAVMGNHELNALAFHTPQPLLPGEHLRPHSEKNIRQHRATLNQLDDEDLANALAWFRTLPASIDTGQVRVVHACWDPTDLQRLSEATEQYGRMTPDFLFHATQPGDPVFEAVERIMKGPELKLPEGCFMTDKEGQKRSHVRIRWYEAPANHTIASYSIPRLSDAVLTATPVPKTARPAPYDATHPPVFFGHYWLSDPEPVPLASNIACVDYSVAKNGVLAAYRYQGEKVLRRESFVTVVGRRHG